jgi:lysozyme family protein
MCAGAVVGATPTRFTPAPGIGLAAAVVAASGALFWYGSRR